MGLSYKPFLVTSKCSAGCLHCPFAQGKIAEPPEPVLKRLDSLLSLLTDDEIVLLTGGEPFGSPHIREIAKKLAKGKRYFRMATGGFIPLRHFSDILLSDWLTGVSLGTDVILNFRNNRELGGIWKINLNYLIDNGIPFSVTITILKGDEIKRIAQILNDIENIDMALFMMVLLDESIDTSLVRSTAESYFTGLINQRPVVFSQVKGELG